MGNTASTMEPGKRQEILRYIHPEVKEYILELESMIQKLKEFETKYKDVNSKFLDAQKDLQEMQDQNKEFKRQLNDLNEQNDKQREEIKKLNEEVKKHQEIVQNQKSINALETQCKEIEAKNLDLQDDLYGIRIRNHEFQSQLKVVSDENQRLHQIIKLLNKENDEGNENQNEQNNKKNEKTTNNPTTASINSINSIIIARCPKSLLLDNPKMSIVWLGEHLQINITEDDITNVTMKQNFYNRYYMQPDKLILIVEFSTMRMKNQFLSQKKKLKHSECTKDIVIDDYVSEDVYHLYLYAKVLKSHGYKTVYCKNNLVYVQMPKTARTPQRTIVVKTGDDVDVLKTTI